MAYEVRNCMGFARAGRTLHHQTVRTFQAANDFNLVIVERFGEENIERRVV